VVSSHVVQSVDVFVRSTPKEGIYRVLDSF
jgi:hypothetical protein